MFFDFSVFLCMFVIILVRCSIIYGLLLLLRLKGGIII